jgi:hypothetical protein
VSGTRNCLDCGCPKADTILPHGRLCLACRRRRHYHPQQCPGCGVVRPLAYIDPDGRTVCAGCVGARSIFACTECGREDQPYGYTRCARCFLRERLTVLLTDPRTGVIHSQLLPVYDALIAGNRPQSTLTWLSKPGTVAPTVLRGLATGKLAISHDTFRHQLPVDRRHCYIRDLLSSTGVLAPYTPAIERITPWLAQIAASLTPERAEILNRYAHWHVLRRMRQHANAGTLTGCIVNGGRANITGAARLLAWATEQNTMISELSQSQLEEYMVIQPGGRWTGTSFITWLGDSGINSNISLPAAPHTQPQVTMPDQARWRGVELLLHDTINTRSRVAGLFLLLFAQPLNQILKMTHDQVLDHGNGRVIVTFDTEPIELPPGVAELVIDHKRRHGCASYRVGDTRWLFPGRLPGRPLVTEPVRLELVSHGIKPRASRSAALFFLAGQIPAPVLADLIGIARNTATRWAALAAHDWSSYTRQRAQQIQSRTGSPDTPTATE